MGTKWIRSQYENEVKATKVNKSNIHSFIHSHTLIIFIKNKIYFIWLNYFGADFLAWSKARKSAPFAPSLYAYTFDKKKGILQISTRELNGCRYFCSFFGYGWLLPTKTKTHNHKSRTFFFPLTRHFIFFFFSLMVGHDCMNETNREQHMSGTSAGVSQCVS